MSPKTFRDRVAARIKKARWRLGWTQADAAFKVGLTFRYFAEIERGRRNPSLDTLFAIARALKDKVWPLLASGAIKPVIHSTFAASDAAKAHVLMESNQHVGKIVLTW